MTFALILTFKGFGDTFWIELLPEPELDKNYVLMP
jgi:hypothetical protein